MTPIQNQRERVLAEAVVSNYLNELSPRERPSRRPAGERELTRVIRLRRERAKPLYSRDRSARTLLAT
jgi:hypothetical protein